MLLHREHHLLVGIFQFVSLPFVLLMVLGIICIVCRCVVFSNGVFAYDDVGVCIALSFSLSLSIYICLKTCLF